MPDTPPIIRKPSFISRRIDQMHNEYFQANMSEEEKIAAKESLKAYDKPRKIYQFLQRRAIKNPLFLQRSLNYQIEAKHQRRIQIQMTLVPSGSVETQKPFPVIIMLARLDSSKPTAESSTAYKFNRTCTIVAGFDGFRQPQPNFLLPRMDRLALDAKSGSLAILFFSFAAGGKNSQFGIDLSKIHSGGHCLWGKIPLESLYSSLKKHPHMDLGVKATSVSLVVMQPCFFEVMSTNEKRAVVHDPSNPFTSSSPQQIQVTISAQEVGATKYPPYSSSFSFNDIPSSSVMFSINRLRKLVAFNYKYYNNKLQKTEVTEDFTCPFCEVKCASFKGLECHMPSTHGFCNFEFWVDTTNPVVDVSLKSEKMINEFYDVKIHRKQVQINEDDPNARLEPYPFSSKKSGRRKQNTPVRNPRPGTLKIDDAESVESEKSQIPPGAAESSSQRVPPGMDSDADSVKSEKSEIPPEAAESSSQRVPPGMGPADLEMMHMWNSFVKEHRLIPEGRIAWGCEAFSKLHGPFLVRNPHLLWCWKKYIWTQRIYGRLDHQTLENCMVFFEQLANLRTEKP